MAENKERRKTPRKPTATSAATPKPDAKAGAPRQPSSEQRAAPMESNLRSQHSPEEMRRQIEEAAYHRAKQRGFEPGHELEDWIEAEAEVRRRNGAS